MHRQGVANRRFHRLVFGFLHRQPIEQAHLPGNTPQAEAVGAIRREADLQHAVVECQIASQVFTHGRIRGEFHQALIGIGEPQFLFRAEHSL